MRKTNYRADFSFFNSSFWIGVGSVLSLFSPYYPFDYSTSPNEVDKKAMRSDFEAVGQDIKKALESFKK